MEQEVSKTLADMLASEPTWLRLWVDTLIAVNLGAVLFAVGKVEGRWRIRPEPFAIMAGFMAAATLMGWIYSTYGYVRLLGLSHIVFWSPAWLWILFRRKGLDRRSLYGGYIHLYLVVAGLSLAVDLVDVIRYMLGDGQLG